MVEIALGFLAKIFIIFANYSNCINNCYGSFYLKNFKSDVHTWPFIRCKFFCLISLVICRALMMEAVVERQSFCELEVDVLATDILNRFDIGGKKTRKSS